MSIYSHLRSLVATGSAPEDAADAVIRKMRKADLAAFVRPLLEDAQKTRIGIENRLRAGADSAPAAEALASILRDLWVVAMAASEEAAA